MSLIRLEARHVRNLTHVVLEPADGCNLIVGPNGSGKTSLLEAIHLLGLARSFRTPHIRHVIQRGQPQLQVMGKLQRGAGQVVALGIERGPDHTRIRIAGQSVAHVSELARYLPIQVLTPESRQILELGPRFRRQYLDWGVFHVEPTFLAAWQAYHRCLRQRNAALRDPRAQAGSVAIWDKQLVEAAEAVTALRRGYLARLEPYLQRHGAALVESELVFHYRPGWPEAAGSYLGTLETGWAQDREMGYTRHGPHRADLSIRADGVAAQDALSRGQQKLLVAAMRLAQVALLGEVLGERCVLLVDDLPAELDAGRRWALLRALHDTGAQLFITATDAELVDCSAWPVPRVFHVEHGALAKVV